MGSTKNSKKNNKIEKDKQGIFPNLIKKRPGLGKFILPAIVLHVIFALVFIVIPKFTEKKDPNKNLNQRVHKVTLVPRPLKVLSYQQVQSSPSETIEMEKYPKSALPPTIIEQKESSAGLEQRQPPWRPKAPRVFVENRPVEFKAASTQDRMERMGAVEKKVELSTGKPLPPPEVEVSFAARHVMPAASIPPEDEILSTRHRHAPEETLSVRRQLDVAPMDASEMVMASPVTEAHPAKLRRSLTASLSSSINDLISASDFFTTGIIGAADVRTANRISHAPPRLVQYSLYNKVQYARKQASLSPRIPDFHDLHFRSKSLNNYIAEMVAQLVQHIQQINSHPRVGIRMKSLTYRDFGLESEVTKLLTGLVKSTIETVDRVEFIHPEEISKAAQVLMTGEVWDHLEEITVRLRFVDKRTNNELKVTEAKIPRDKFPDEMVFKPPQGQSLSIIHKIVHHINRIFPKGGDFQLNVWSDKGIGAVYVDGDNLVLRILADMDCYLYVDYYQVDGSVVHILPNASDSNAVKAGRPLIIGKPESIEILVDKNGRPLFDGIPRSKEYRVQSPFGEELLLVVASQEKMNVVTKTTVEAAEPYIEQLMESISKQQSKIKMAGTHLIILTRKKQQAEALPEKTITAPPS